MPPILPPISMPNALSPIERRAIARHNMERYAGLGKFMYLLHTGLVRHQLSNDVWQHSIIDVVNILSESEDDPRNFWKFAKKRMVKDDFQLGEKITQLRLPSWADGKRYATDVTNAGGLLLVVFELHTPISNSLRHAIADMLTRYDNRHAPAIIAELEGVTGWAATRTHEDTKGVTKYSDSELDWWQR